MVDIRGFFGEYRYLSNFWIAPIVLEGQRFQTVEHFFQASKATSDSDFNYVAYALGPKLAKGRGRDIKIRPDWDKIKDSIMLKALNAKFDQHPDLCNLLLGTQGCYLEETNSWNDTYWGVCNGKGLNKLGIMLMQIRQAKFFEKLME